MALDFDIRKYKHDGKITSTNLAGASYHLVDGSDSLANQVGQVISFQNVRNDKDVFFRDSKFEVVDLDESFPEYIVKNKERFAHLIRTE